VKMSLLARSRKSVYCWEPLPREAHVYHHLLETTGFKKRHWSFTCCGMVAVNWLKRCPNFTTIWIEDHSKVTFYKITVSPQWLLNNWAFAFRKYYAKYRYSAQKNLFMITIVSVQAENRITVSKIDLTQNR
jgi:hypothetical protein